MSDEIDMVRPHCNEWGSYIFSIEPEHVCVGECDGDSASGSHTIIAFDHQRPSGALSNHELRTLMGAPHPCCKLRKPDFCCTDPDQGA